MSFFRTAWRAASDPSFYAERERAPFGPGLRYLAGWMLILTLVAMAGLVINLRASLRGASIAELQDRIIAAYPAELVLTLEDGRIASNVNEPYAIALPAEFSACHGKDCPKERLPKSLIVIDTAKPIESADFKRHDTLIILGAREMGFANPKDNKIEIHRLDSFANDRFTLTRATFADMVHKLFRALKWFFVAALFFVPVAVYAFFLLGTLVYLLFGALIVWLAARLRRLSLTYGQAYKLGFYLLTPTLVYDVLTSAWLWPAGRLPFVGSLILGIAAYALLRAPASQTDSKGAAPPETPSPASPAVTPPNAAA